MYLAKILNLRTEKLGAKAFPVHLFYKNDQSNSTAESDVEFDSTTESTVEFDWSKPKTEKCGPRSQLSCDATVGGAAYF